jgi:hypothetical protein
VAEILLAGGLIVLTVAALACVAFAFGKSAARKEALTNTLETGKAVRDALDAAPRDPASLAERLRRSGG